MMSSSITPWKTVPQVGGYGRPAMMTWRDVDWAGYEHDLTVAGSRLHSVTRISPRPFMTTPLSQDRR